MFQCCILLTWVAWVGSARSRHLREESVNYLAAAVSHSTTNLPTNASSSDQQRHSIYETDGGGASAPGGGGGAVVADRRLELDGGQPAAPSGGICMGRMLQQVKSAPKHRHCEA